MIKKKDLYRIGEISKIANVPIRTLHHYNDVGLLVPVKVDETSGYRYYSHEQLHDISQIKFFKAAGFSLKDIKGLIHNRNKENSCRMIQEKTEVIRKEILKLQALKDKLNMYVTSAEGKDMDKSEGAEVCIKEISIQNVAFSRYKAPCNNDEFYLRFTKLNNIIEKNKLEMVGSMMAIYYDDYRTFNYDQADIEVCVRVQNVESDYVRKFGGFLAAVSYHYGSYREMNITYKRMLEWIEKNSFEFAGGAVENYLVDGITTSLEEEYITEIILPVKKLK